SLLRLLRSPTSSLFPYTTLFRSSPSTSAATLRAGSCDGTRDQRAPARSRGTSRMGRQGHGVRCRLACDRPDPHHRRADRRRELADLLVELVGPRPIPPSPSTGSPRP